MASFKPMNAGTRPTDFEPRGPMPVPRDGSRKARTSLIIDLGVQNREDFVDEKTGETKEQKPCQQVVVFADLVADNVDYGGSIGKQQYRLLLNKSFKNEVVGINFTKTPPKDADGKLLEGKPWGLHPANLLTKLAKAIGKPEIAVEGDAPENLDISLLLDEPFMANVVVKKTEAKDKKDKEGNPIVYTNVNYAGCAPVPHQEDDDGNDIGPIPVPELKQKPRCVTFDSAEKEDIQFIRPSLIKVIKQANNYAGSQMQKAIEAYEAEKATAGDEKEEAAEAKPAGKPTAKKAANSKPKEEPKPATNFDDMDDDIPF